MIVKGIVSAIHQETNKAEIILPEYDNIVTQPLSVYGEGSVTDFNINDFVIVEFFNDDFTDGIIIKAYKEGLKSVTWEQVTGKPSTFPPSVHKHTKADIKDFAHNHSKADITDFAHKHKTAEIEDFPTTMPPSKHSHTKAEITDFAHNHKWSEIEEKPTQYTPTAHKHKKAEIEDFPTTMPPTSHTHSWSAIEEKPTSFTPKEHTHPYLPLTGGTITGTTKHEAKVDLTARSYINGISAIDGKELLITGISEKDSFFFGNGGKALQRGISYFDGNETYLRSNKNIGIIAEGGEIKLDAKTQDVLLMGNNVHCKGELIDRYGQKIDNAVACYNSTAPIDPNQTLDELILTSHANAPFSGRFAFIRTIFYGGKTITSNRTQIAYPYSNEADSICIRFYHQDKWSNWKPLSQEGHSHDRLSDGLQILKLSGTNEINFKNSNTSLFLGYRNIGGTAPNTYYFGDGNQAADGGVIRCSKVYAPPTPVSWHRGRDSSPFRARWPGTGSGFIGMITGATPSGSWDIGTTQMNNNLYFQYITDANYKADNNSQTMVVYFDPSDNSVHCPAIRSGNIYSSSVIIPASDHSLQSTNNGRNINLIFGSSTNNVIVGGGSLPPEEVYITSKSASMRIGNDGSPIVASAAIYNRTYSSSPNCYITSYGTIGRHASSSRKYKTDIIPISENLVKQSKLRKTRSINQVINPHSLYDIPVMQYKYIEGYLSHDDPTIGNDVIGIMAEDIAEHFPAAAIYDDNGEPEAWNSEPVLVGLLYLVQELKGKIEELNGRIEELENKLAHTTS